MFDLGPAVSDTSRPDVATHGRFRDLTIGSRQAIRSHPVLFVFGIALLVRVCSTLFVVGYLGDGFLGKDDDTYFRMAVQAAEGTNIGWDSYTRGLFDRTAAFLLPLTALVEVFGPSRLVANLLVGLIGATVAAGATALGVRLAGNRAGLTAGLVVALLPSQVAWSTTTLKDPLVWALELGAVLAFVFGITAARARPMGIAGAGVSLFVLSYTRLHSAVVLGWALPVATLWMWRRWGYRPFLAALLIAFSVPWLVGAGPGGSNSVLSAPTPSTQRELGAQGADSAIETPDTSDTTEASPQEISPPGWVTSLAELRHLPRGYSVMLLEPYPWHPRNDARFLLAKIDTVLWYPVVGFALFGAVRSIKRMDPGIVVVVAVASLGTMLALFEGNLGTAFRHRGELVWGMAVLAGIGWSRRAARVVE